MKEHISCEFWDVCRHPVGTILVVAHSLGEGNVQARRIPIGGGVEASEWMVKTVHLSVNLDKN